MKQWVKMFLYLVVACPAGYGSNDDISGCIECPEGTYSDSIGDEKCMACPTNYTTIGTKSNKCIGMFKYFHIESICYHL